MIRKSTFALLLAAALFASAEEVKLKIIETTDVHGAYFPQDFITMKPTHGSLARVSGYVNHLRDSLGTDKVVLLDNGDFLQGQPTAYYYNYMDTVSPHLPSQILNYMGYDAVTIGNHDVETGHAVYDRWVAQNNCPTLGANVVDTATGQPYLMPYTIIKRDGVKMAVLGLLTPAIPGWLPEVLWSGLRFDDMVESAKYWVDYIQQHENPDVMVGLFHSGRDHTKTTGNVIENASLLVAEQVPGFDMVLMGHDHSPYCQKVANIDGKEVLVINPANNAMKVAEIDLTLDVNDGKASIKDIDGRLVSVADMPIDEAYMTKFSQQVKDVENFVSRELGYIDTPMSTHDAFFGPSSFVDLTHQIQLAISGAEISMAAPLSFDSEIPAGTFTVSDAFALYKYENMLYTMLLTGREVKDYLEMSYDMWTNQMHSPDDHLLRLRENSNPNDMTHTGFQYPSYNFDSASGILYTVDVTQPKGSKITIESMADGTPFGLDKTYRVAINSYRGNGGGNLLTQGAGIPQEELTQRIETSTDRDLRYYLIEYISEHPHLSPKPLNQWQFIPSDLVAPAAARDRHLLFND